MWAKEVVTRYPKLKYVGKARALACKMAQEAVFGEVMRRCTPPGNKHHPGPPYVEMKLLKEAIRGKFPSQWSNQAELESVWSKCVEAIEHACVGDSS